MQRVPVVSPGSTQDEIPIRMAGFRMKQEGVCRRLNGMHAPMLQIAFSAIRIGAMVALSMLLILGLLPAILAVQTASW